VRRTIAALAAASALLLVAGCATGPSEEGAETITLVTHDSFGLGEGTLEAFTAETGIEVVVHQAGDAGALVNQLVLTKDNPLGDVVFGIDNTFASRAVDEGVLADYAVDGAPEQYLLPAGMGREQLTPITNGDVCVNVDHAWFEEAGLEEPTTLDDLIDPAYADLFVTPGANTSSPGLAFLLATIAASGEDGWQDYWTQLLGNGAKVVAGWSDAYYVDFSGPSSEGDRPIVLSYGSSPAFEVADGVTPTGALLDTCFRQTEYAGVLAGTEHADAAQQLVDFLYSVEAQDQVAPNMYVFPVNPAATLPEEWAAAAEVAEQPFVIAPEEIDANRERWIEEWAAIAIP
jgi:thiamine transport system substrate-binding protein